MLVCALLGVMVAGQAMAATLRYQQSGSYFDTVAVTGVNGWPAGGGGPDGLPGAADTIRCNFANNTVTLNAEAPTILSFQLGVDESGQLVVESGGKLSATSGSTVGNNNTAAVIGRLTVNAGGEVNVTNWLQVGAKATGILTIDGGTVNITSHLWVGSQSVGVGTVNIANGGVFNVGGNIGLGTLNASTPSGGKGFVNVQAGGVLNLSQISAVNSIQPDSVLDISGSGLVTIPGDLTAVIGAYTNAQRITAYAGLGTVGIDYDIMNAGKTTLFAIAGEVPPTDVVWNPAANFPDTNGLWNVGGNWTGGVRPANVTKVTFNVVGAIPCTVTNVAVADYVIMGDNGPGGTLIIANGGSLTASDVNSSAIGYNSNALMVVENGGSASFGNQLWLGFDLGSDGTLIMNGGTVSVAGMFGLGNWAGGKGTAHINGGTLKLSQFDDSNSIQGDSVLDVAGTGVVVINGDHQEWVNYYISIGQITNGGAGTVVVDYDHINLGKTTLYPSGFYVPPEQVVWDPSLNFPDTNGLWNVGGNWIGGVDPGNVTTVIFNVADAIPCTITDAAFANYVSMGQGGPGGTLIITNGGSLTCSAGNWSAIGRNNTALMIVENGASASFGDHLWIGLDTGSDGTLTMNGGTVSVTGMFSCGWLGGKGTALINGGTLNLNQWHPTDSLKGDSLLNVAGTGKVVINGNQFTSVSNYVSAGKITADGGPNVFYSYDAGANKTTISAELLPAPRQSITVVSVSGGNVSITYQTTDRHTYHIESTPSLSPPSWTPVAGSTNTATGVPVTFTFPVGSGQMFYRTVSP